MATQAAPTPVTEAPVAVREKKSRANAVTWPVRLGKRVGRLQSELEVVMEQISSIDAKQANRYKVSLDNILGDVKEAISWVDAVRAHIAAFPPKFYPKSRNRQVKRYEVGETIKFRPTAPDTFKVYASQKVTVTAVAKQTISFRAADGSVGVALASHIMRENE